MKKLTELDREIITRQRFQYFADFYYKEEEMKLLEKCQKNMVFGNVSLEGKNKQRELQRN